MSGIVKKLSENIRKLGVGGVSVGHYPARAATSKNLKKPVIFAYTELEVGKFVFWT